jgi:O-methyltransferase involved in polyketide biosynthesis
MMASADPAGMAQAPLAVAMDLAEAARAPAPNAARIYDALLGGMHNTPAGRAAAAELVRLVPGAVTAAYQNKQFIQRSVRFLVRQAGIRQFIDIGTGLPTQSTVHQIAGQSAPRVRVLYTDNDPLVLSLVQTLLADYPSAAVIGHDLRDPAGLLRHPALRTLIDPDQPTAILLSAVLEYIKYDADPASIICQLTDAAAPGSYLALSHATSDNLPPATARQASDLYAAAGSPYVPRSGNDIAGLLSGLEILPPGLVNGSAWRPGRAAADPRRALFSAALARKR